MTENDLPLLLSYRRAGGLLDCSIDTIKRRIKDGSLEKRKVGRLSRVTTASVLALANPDPQPVTDPAE
jgi:hypothetical protein